MKENKDYNNVNNNSSIKTSFRAVLSKSASNINEVTSNMEENKWIKILLQYFTIINSIDNQIEKIRSKLNYIKNFSSSNLFNYLDKNSKKFLTLNDFKSFLQSNQIQFTEKNLRQFIHNFDKDNDFSINFKEFLGIISLKKLRKQDKNEPAVPDEGEGEKKIDEEIKKVFGELIIEELKYVEKCYELSQNIKNSKDFTTYEAFTEIVGEEKYINLQNLGNFIKKKGLNMTNVEINQLMFRIDKDNDGMISYEEFKEIFLTLNDIDFKYKEYKNDDYMKYYNDNKNNSNKYDINNKLEFKYNKKENNYKIDLPLKFSNIKINKNLNNKENKENNKNEINIKQRYNYNTNIEHIENIELKDKKIIYENEDMPNMSYSLYDEKLYDKSISIDAQKINKIQQKKDTNIKKPNKRNLSNPNLTLNDSKSMDNYRKKSNNNLLYTTKAILNYDNKENKKEININNKVNNNTEINNYKLKNKNTNRINNNILKTPIKIEENNKKQDNKNKGEKFLDTFLNFDYSRYTNKDRDNGQYYFKQKNKYTVSEPIVKNTIEENKINNSNNNSKYIKNNNFKKYENSKSNYLSNKNNYNKEYIIENKDIFHSKYISDNKNLYDEESINNSINNYTKNNNNSDIEFKKEQNMYKSKLYNNKINIKDSPVKHYKVMNNYDNYISNNMHYKKYENFISNNNYKKTKNNKINNSQMNPYLNYNIEDNLEQNNMEEQYLDSLENIDDMVNYKNNNISKNLKKPKKKYHYNTKLTRNLQDKIQDRINNSYKFNNDTNDSTMNFNYNKNNNDNNIYKTFFAKEKSDNHNRSSIISYKNDDNELFDYDNKYSEKLMYNNKTIDRAKNKDKSLYNINCSSKRCPKCNCFNEIINHIEEENKYDNYQNHNHNLNLSNLNNNTNNNYKNKFSNNKHSSLPKNIFKKNNNLNLNINYNEIPNIKSFYLENNYNNNSEINKINNNKHYYSNNIYKKNKDPNIIENKNINNINYDSFYNLLLEFIKQDTSLENIRKTLSMREDANLTDIFELFDHSSNQLISSIDFIETLKELGLYLDNDEIKYVFKKFNKKVNQYFAFEEFSEIILPKKYSTAKIMNEKENGYYYEISDETKNIIIMLFKNIIEGEKSNENYRKIICKNGKFTGYDLFNKIKKSYSIGIYKEDISNFMKKNKYKVSNAELELLMERFDKNKDGMIDYKEFLNEISPMNEL